MNTDWGLQHSSCHSLTFRLLFVVAWLTWGGASVTLAQASETQTRPAGNEMVLTVGKPVERELKAGEVHVYPFTLAGNQCLNIKVHQQNLNVALRVIDPDGKEGPYVSGSEETIGPDYLTLATTAPGTYRIEICPADPKAQPGRYTIVAQELRQATPNDRDRMWAQHQYRAGIELMEKESAGAIQEAMKLLETVREAFHRVGDPFGEANTIDLLASCHRVLGDKKKAKEINLAALPLKKAAQDPMGEATTLNNIAVVCHQTGEYPEAIAYYEQAIKLCSDYGDHASESILIGNIAGVYDKMGEKQKALEYYRRAIPIKKAYASQLSLAQTYNNIGVTYSDLSEYKLAVDNMTQGLELCDAKIPGSKFLAGYLYNNLGKVTNASGEPQKALDYLRRSLDLFQEVGNKDGQSMVLTNTGYAYMGLGETRKAIELFAQALPLCQAAGSQARECQVLNNLGYSYCALGDMGKGLESFNQAFELGKKLTDPFGQAGTLNNLGKYWLDRGDTPKALEYLQQALPLTRTTGNRGSEALTLQLLGVGLNRTGKKTEGLEALNQSVQLWQEIGNRGAAADALATLAQTEQEQGRLTAAKAHIEQALGLIEFIRSRVGRQELRTSYFATAQAQFQIYLNILLGLHEADPQAGFDRLAFNASEQARARSLLDLLNEAQVDLRQGVDPRLLDEEQNLKKRITGKFEGLSKLLAGKHTAEQKNRAETELQTLTEQYRQLQAEIRQKSPKYAALTQARPITVEELQKDLLDPETLLLEYVLGEKKSHLFAITQTGFSVYELPAGKDISQLARHAYDLLTTRATGLKKSAQAQTPGNSEAEYHTQVQQADQAYPAVAARLSRLLLGPVAPQLHRQRLVIVADGMLQMLPFAALPEPDGAVHEAGNHRLKPTSRRRQQALAKQAVNQSPLMSRHEIVVLPSASTIKALRRETGGHSQVAHEVAILADPVFSASDERLKTKAQAAPATPDGSGFTTRYLDQFDDEASSPAEPGTIKQRQLRIPRLPATRLEAEAIRAISGNSASVRLDFQASKPAAMGADLSSFRYIHLATHGYVNAARPELSAVLLSLVNEAGEPVDGFLRLEDLFNLNWPAEVVTLSACQTGLGAEVKGEGLIGLTRGLMYAGARRVVVSSWNVSDQATAAFMTEFYRGMLKDKLRPAAALQAAQKKMLTGTKWQAPFYWAAFQLQGEWR
ncbi:MAG: CHAT domain-containing protein [Blastocatellia bacterium]|nr:CHAT domain-containing protein [Blastocatellia bacterium]